MSQQSAVTELESIQEKLINSLVLPTDYKRIPTFSLLNPKGDEATESLFSEKWSLVFFGYTNCPDICPTTLAIAKSAIDKLAKEPVFHPQVVFVTVDPERDTASHLDKYLNYFDPNFTGITGDVNQLSKWVSSLGISFQRHNEENTIDYTVDHSATILLVDPENRIRGSFNTPLEVDTIVSDYQTIVQSSS